MKKDDQYWCDKFHADRDELACQEFELSIKQHLKAMEIQWLHAHQPEKYGCQLQIMFPNWYNTIADKRILFGDNNISIFEIQFKMLPYKPITFHH